MTIPTTNEQVARLCGWESRTSTFGGTYCIFRMDDGQITKYCPNTNPGDALAALEAFRKLNPSQVDIKAGQHSPWRVCLFLRDGREGVAHGNFCDAVCSAIIAAGEKT